MNKKKIGIYDKWLHTFGGGEKVATVMAEVLSKKGFDVELIGSFEVDKQTLQSKMGVDLRKVQLLTWYERSYSKLEPLTKKYDLFINISYLDHLASRAKKSLYYVLFPTPVRKTLLGFIKYRSLLPYLRKFLIIPEIVSGVGQIDDVYTRTGRWLSSENTILLNNSLSNFNITLRIYVEKLTESSLQKIHFTSPNATLSVLDRHIEHEHNVICYKLHLQTTNGSSVIKISIKDFKENAYGLVSITVKSMRFTVWNLLKRYLPKYEMALYGSSVFLPEQGLDTYDLFLADSRFSQYWTKQYLEKDSGVLYPPVDVAEFKPGKKKNYILSVGRFFVGGHAKRQDILIDTFKRMYTAQLIPSDWELHFVGGVNRGKMHEEYLATLQKSAENFPIYFHLSAEYSTLKTLYAEAKIYWHATGFGVDQNKEPIRTEHFGITPVEAMASGAVPLIYNAGGVPEVVENNPALLWNSQEELIEKTISFIKNPDKLKKQSTALATRAKYFSKKSFIEGLEKALQELQITP